MIQLQYIGTMTINFNEEQIEAARKNLAAEKPDGVGVAQFQLNERLQAMAKKIALANTGGTAVFCKNWVFPDRATFTYSYDFKDTLTKEGEEALVWLI